MANSGTKSLPRGTLMASELGLRFPLIKLLYGGWASSFLISPQKNGHSYITAEKPDVFCLQETKCAKESIPDDANIEGYHVYWLSGDKEGYSGTGLYSKEKPISVTYGIGKCAAE
jgi:hypothetical protein